VIDLVSVSAKQSNYLDLGCGGGQLCIALVKKDIKKYAVLIFTRNDKELRDNRR